MTNTRLIRPLFLLAAFISFLLSVVLWFGGHHAQGAFVGLWVPSVLALGAFLAPAGGPGSSR